MTHILNTIREDMQALHEAGIPSTTGAERLAKQIDEWILEDLEKEAKKDK